MHIKITEDYRHLFQKDHKHYKTRNLVWYGGRGSGKTMNVADGLLIRGMESKSTILCVREFQNSIADSVIKTLETEIVRLGLQDHYTVMANGIRGKNGTEFVFKGVKNNVQSIKSMADLDYIWAEEAQTISDNSWETLIPTLRKPGSQFLITFNPSSPNDPTYKRFVSQRDDETYALKVNYDRNPWFPEPLRKEMEKLKANDPEAWAHVYCGNFDTRRSGAVYAKQLSKARDEGRIAKVPYNSASQVFTAWDLGYGDSTTIWWLQWQGRELAWLEYYENAGEQLEHYVQIIKGKPYNYSTHYLPHDGDHGNIRGLSVSKQLRQMGLKTHTLDREVDIAPGIDLLRQTIGFSVFNASKCAEGLRCLENHAYKWDEERGIFKDKPSHDWTSHAADAARYAAFAAPLAKSPVGIAKPIKPLTFEHAGWG